MDNKCLILRKDHLRIRQRVKYHIRRGKIRAEIAEDKRLEKVVRSLRIDFNEAFEPHTQRIIEAIVREFGPLTEDAIYGYFIGVLAVGGLMALEEGGELEVKKDSYGRTTYRMKSHDDFTSQSRRTL